MCYSIFIWAVPRLRRVFLNLEWLIHELWVTSYLGYMEFFTVFLQLLIFFNG